MNIIQITPYYPPNLGGLQNCVEELSKRLAKKSYQVEVLTSNISYKGNSPLVINKNLIVKYLNSIEFANTPIAFSLIKELFKIPKRSILHIHIANAFFPDISYLIAKVRKIKYIVHYHIDVESSGFFGIILPLYKKIVLKSIIKDAEKVLCLTESQRELIISKYGIDSNNIVIVPNGINEDFFQKKGKNNKTNIINLLFVGRLSKQKNLPRIINAMRYLDNKYMLHIVGDGDQKDMLSSLADSLKLKNICWHGRRVGKELIELYQQSDIFILPSDNEGMSLSILEALAVGLPIIATDLKQTKDFLGDNAILISNPDPMKYAKAIVMLANDVEKRLEMSNKNIEIAKRYSWDDIVLSIEKVYTEIS